MRDVSSFDLLDARQRASVDARVAEGSKSVLAAYLLWWFLGVPLFLHRFYLDRRGGPYAAATVVFVFLFLLGGSSGLTIVGALGSVVMLVVWVADAFRIAGWIDDDDLERRAFLADQMLGGSADHPERTRRPQSLVRAREKLLSTPVEPNAVAPTGPVFKDD